MNNFLKVSKIGDLKTGKDGLNYVQVWFKPMTMLSGGQEVFSNQKEKSRILFGENGESKGDPLFEEVQTKRLIRGSIVEGQLFQFNTTEYQPEGYEKPVTSYSCVVFKGENAITYANRQLRDSYACVIDPVTSEVSNPSQLERPVTVKVAKVNMSSIS